MEPLNLFLAGGTFILMVICAFAFVQFNDYCDTLRENAEKFSEANNCKEYLTDDIEHYYCVAIKEGKEQAIPFYCEYKGCYWEAR